VNENNQYGKFTEKPPLDIIEGEKEWEVEDIIEERRKDGHKEYLVYWRGCYDSELLARSNCDRNPRQPCILFSSPARGSG